MKKTEHGGCSGSSNHEKQQIHFSQIKKGGGSNMKHLMIAAIGGLLIMVMHDRLRAQDAYLGPQLGIYKATDADNTRLMGGAALRLRLTPGLGVEGSIGYRNEDYAGWPFMVTGLLYPLPIVYGLIGAGWYNNTLSYNGSLLGQTIPSATQQKFGWHFGAGAELPAGANMLITGDIRYVFLNYNFQQVPGTSGLKSNFYVITVGLLFGL